MDSKEFLIRKIAIGSGRTKIAGFLNVDVDPANEPDFVMDIQTLNFPARSLSCIYASHVFEHLKPSGNRFEFYISVLTQWRSRLTDDGVLMIGVPDFEKLVEIFVQNKTRESVLRTVIDAISGGARNEHDFHYGLFTKSILTELLERAGFAKIETFEAFVNDETKHRILGNEISLNLVASNSPTADLNVETNQEKSPAVEDELTGLRRAADERLELIIKLDEECRQKDAVIQRLQGSFAYRVISIFSKLRNKIG